MARGVCPICGGDAPDDPRAPRCVCAACAARAVDRDGRPVAFGNVDVFGGLRGWHPDDDSDYPLEVCWIDGWPCEVSEGRFGGVRVQVAR